MGRGPWGRRGTEGKGEEMEGNREGVGRVSRGRGHEGAGRVRGRRCGIGGEKKGRMEKRVGILSERGVEGMREATYERGGEGRVAAIGRGGRGGKEGVDW